MTGRPRFIYTRRLPQPLARMSNVPRNSKYRISLLPSRLPNTVAELRHTKLYRDAHKPGDGIDIKTPSVQS